ncbi:transmembrane protein 222 isoform X4 [Orcinus orca]|uniref:transmembrane protein 222 isoform X4 n=1 Tax=Orcinus orca TaxID=9733 RepID=UPI002112DB16|nr:transmembrane protein 222 isoform X4 [Orcinus orca]
MGQAPLPHYTWSDLRERPLLTAERWFFPIIGHMGICTSTGVIRDFAGPYFVSEDNMAFGKPAKYWKLDPAQVYASGPNAWDTAVHDASEEYKHRMHSLCCDNCHSHVALALNLMRYNNSTNWNMVTLCFFCLLYGKYVRLKTSGPLAGDLSPDTGVIVDGVRKAQRVDVSPVPTQRASAPS